MVRKIFNKAISAVTTTLLAFTTLASAIPVTTYAANPTVKSKTELKKQSDPAGAGFGTFVFDSDVGHGVQFSCSKNLKKADKSSGTKDWIWASEKMEDMMKVLVVMQLRNVLEMHGFRN